jgi:hypothetical protein
MKLSSEYSSSGGDGSHLGRCTDMTVALSPSNQYGRPKKLQSDHKRARPIQTWLALVHGLMNSHIWNGRTKTFHVHIHKTIRFLTEPKTMKEQNSMRDRWERLSGSLLRGKIVRSTRDFYKRLRHAHRLGTNLEAMGKPRILVRQCNYGRRRLGKGADVDRSSWLAIYATFMGNV